jgi:putative redox protein
MDVISILEKKRQDVRGLEVRVTGAQREDDYPRIYTRIQVEYVVIGHAVDLEAVRRAIELSEEKYCSVRGMLGAEVEVTTTFRVLESPMPGTPLITVVDAEV